MYRFVLLFGFVLLTGCARLPPTAAHPSTTHSPTFTPAAQPTETTADHTIALPDPASAAWVEVLSGFTRPLALMNAGDDRVFVVEQRGFIWAVDWGQDKPQVFLDIRDRVNDRANEQGLLGLAFHPSFNENGRFFVNYSGVNGETIIAEYHADPNHVMGNSDSERVLLRIDQPYANHNGGALSFGPLAISISEQATGVLVGTRTATASAWIRCWEKFCGST